MVWQTCKLQTYKLFTSKLFQGIFEKIAFVDKVAVAECDIVGFGIGVKLRCAHRAALYGARGGDSREITCYLACWQSGINS